jgi:alpha-D-xyloside xylohydrolase
LKLELCADDIVRVAYARDEKFFARDSLMTAPKRCPGGTFTQSETDTETTFKTSKLGIKVERASGRVTFLAPDGTPILAEKVGGGRTLTAATIQDEATNNVRQEWEPSDDEALYGLGQHQDGLLDIKGHDLDLKQYNSQSFVPFLVSSRGYGVLWDNDSFSRFGDLRPWVAIAGTTGLYASQDDSGAVEPGNGSIDWQGTVSVPTTGDYLFQTYASGDVKLWVGDALVIDHYRQSWLPYTEQARVRLQAGQSLSLRLKWTREGDVNAIRLMWKPPASSPPSTSLWSEVADGVDYYFVYGPALDHVVAGYRALTGQAPMPPRWALGLWQSRERYQTSQQSLDVLAGFRSRSIPVDVIVQDWQYWADDQWGSHAFDPTRFPDAAAWIKSIHDTYHARLLISVWPKFYPNTANAQALRDKGFLYELNLTEQRKDFIGHVFTFYDAFNPAARQLYWSQIQTQLFSKGADAWWLDASEPDIVEGPYLSPEEQLSAFKTHMNPTALGSGSRVLNAYSLVNSQAVYEGQRAATSDQRVMILTRNGFAGQQRYGAATWSGDITSSWTALRKQIPAGLGFSISGVPYWTNDSGGFSVPPRWSAANPSAADLAEWRELNTRWFELSTFLPLLRVHGQAPAREMWQFGGDDSPDFKAQLKFDRLRYRLLPYLYSLAGGVTHEAGTLLRPLVMDFPADVTAREVTDQFMLGPALLVSPVTSYQAQSREVYVPAGTWYDFWTGAAVTGGSSQTVAAPLDSIPVHVRAGSIVPLGPELQYTGEKPADPLLLMVYAGANGELTLYEDDGQSYGYEKGELSRIPIRWDDAAKTLTLGARSGSYPGMLTTRTVQIVLVSGSKSVGFSFTPQPDQMLSYTGEAISAKF